MRFKEVDIKKSNEFNPFVTLGDDWGLLTAGDTDKYNTMTIAWGSFGVMWNKPVLTVVVRPQRYTKEFVDNFDLFTVSFFRPQEDFRKALQLLGTKSGRDCDKITESGLTPLFVDGTVAFEEANTIYICKKLHGGQQLDASKFVDLSLDSSIYPDKDYHYFYIGEILKILQ